KSLEAPGLEFEVERKLPEYRPKLFPKQKHPLSEEVRHGHLGGLIPEAQYVSHIPRACHTEDKVGRRLVVPSPKAFRRLKLVVRPIYFYGAHRVRSEMQLARLAQAFRVKKTAPTAIAPPGYADAHDARLDVASHMVS